MLHLGFSASKCDPSLFIFKDASHIIYLLVYADDIIIVGSFVTLVQQFTIKLHSNFSLKQLQKLDYFLGIEVKSMDDGSILLTQSKYITDLLQKTKMAKVQPISSPMVSRWELTKTGTNILSDPTLYRSMVGALQYSTITRPERSFVVNKVCQFLANPLETHWTTVKRILRFLKSSLHHSLLLKAATPRVPIPLKHSMMQIRHLTLMIEGLHQRLLFILVQISYLGGLRNNKL